MAATNDPGLPIKLDPVSNGEYVPLPASEVVREAQRRARQMCEENARRIGMDRRRFLLSSMGAATTLAALAACSKDSNESKGSGKEPGGNFKVDDDAMVDPDAALDALGGDYPVIDVQSHLLEYPSDYTGFHLGEVFAGAKDCRNESMFDCFNTDRYLEEVFERSDTTLAVLSALPVIGEVDPLSAEVMAQSRDEVDKLCGDGRVMVQGHAFVNVGDVQPALDAMEAELQKYPISAWKTYTHIGRAGGFFLDDHDPAGVQCGEAFLAKVEEIGPKIVCVHKGFASIGGDAKYADPVDIGPAAKNHPDINFCVYHSGFEANAADGPYDPAKPNAGVDRLIKSLEDNEIGPGGNVYAELGSTWKVVMGDPERAAHVLGKLLVAVGEDRILWGTDSIWYGSPQDQIQALRTFEISEEFQERFGYPALTEEIKHKIFWRNAATLHDIETPRKPCEMSAEETEQARQSSQLDNRTYGPISRRAALQLMRAEHPWAF
jgi:uncharacterized protein